MCYTCELSYIVGDLQRLLLPDGLVVRNAVDLSDLARINDYLPWCLDDGKTTGLAVLLAHYLHAFLPLKHNSGTAFVNTDWPIPLKDEHIICTELVLINPRWLTSLQMQVAMRMLPADCSMPLLKLRGIIIPVFVLSTTTIVLCGCLA